MASNEPHFLPAAALAGPLVAFLFGLSLLVASIPDTLDLGLSDVAMAFVFLLASLVVGFLPGLAAAALGGFIMRGFIRLLPAADHEAAWALAGGLIGACVPFLLGADLATLLVFGTAGAICALVCRPPESNSGGRTYGYTSPRN